jgi:hypothetical protein
MGSKNTRSLAIARGIGTDHGGAMNEFNRHADYLCVVRFEEHSTITFHFIIFAKIISRASWR